MAGYPQYARASNQFSGPSPNQFSGPSPNQFSGPAETSIAWYIGVAIVAFFIIAYVCAWSSARKVAGTYRFVRQEQRVTPTDAQAKAYENANRDSILTITLSALSTSVVQNNADGTLRAKYSGDLPFWYKADLNMVDENGTVITQDTSYHLEYIPYEGGYPNIVITQNDSEGQFLMRWIYTVKADKIPVILDTSAHPEWTTQKL